LKKIFIQGFGPFIPVTISIWRLQLYRKVRNLQLYVGLQFLYHGIKYYQLILKGLLAHAASY